MSQFVYTKIEMGLEKPITFLHMSDTHLTLCDDRNDERKNILARARCTAFPNADAVLCEAEKYARENHRMIVHTGDLVDFVSEACLDRARKFSEENDLLFAAGNHEFSLYVGEAFEDAAYREISLSHVDEQFENNIRFASREVDGVNFVAVDNGYYLFDMWQLDALKNEVKKGLPIILCMHVPLYCERLFDEQKRRGWQDVALTAVPPERMEGYSDYRLRQQTADAITLETVEYIKNEPMIKAIVCGHLHYDFECEVSQGKMQYITGMESLREITLL